MTSNLELVQPIEFIVDIEQAVLSTNDATRKLKTVFGNIVTFMIRLLILSVLPLFILVINAVFYFLSKKINKIKIQSETAINHSTFNEVRELHHALIILIELTEKLISNKRKYILFSKPLISMRNDAIYINNLCTSKFLYSKEDMLMSEEDFNAYQKSLLEFEDIWNYKDSEEDFKQIFDHKKTVA